ncbi:MAG: DUF4065 domain-containing protein [Candidatus Moeniiplasma glomeromycotorum]|nr:DUF4065 domain-containing protein [Candidatus Moeniiplasma glomeromycotorum]MCE8162250.1 DUF4065 domain-containing protein [Candidatus Moeniiplasma glomeromycotorum]MCE8166094.1 DUF4065 domain-containing protein [Candidatus Moeniiplasma glomeromycotorum]MCE8166649.1 DUF4065 domain-containing protein [Candidatus Moeniiplasma glomeromycotorum]
MNIKNTKTELPKVSATIVAKYLLSLDLERKYFSKNQVLIIDDKDNYRSKPTIGNFRLNKMLQIIQALYYACYSQPLFEDDMVAFENGGVVFKIYRGFMKLHEEKSEFFSSYYLTTKQQEFISKVFSYLKDHYSDNELRDLAHEDVAWQKAWKSGKKFIYNNEVLEYYKALSSSMLRAMGLLEEMDR